MVSSLLLNIGGPTEAMATSEASSFWYVVCVLHLRGAGLATFYFINKFFPVAALSQRRSCKYLNIHIWHEHSVHLLEMDRIIKRR